MKTLKRKLKEEFKNEILPMTKWIGLGFLGGVVWAFFASAAIKPLFGYSVASQVGSYAVFGPIIGFGVFVYNNSTSKLQKLKKQLARIKKEEQAALDPDNYKKS